MSGLGERKMLAISEYQMLYAYPAPAHVRKTVLTCRLVIIRSLTSYLLYLKMVPAVHLFNT